MTSRRCAARCGGWTRSTRRRTAPTSSPSATTSSSRPVAARPGPGTGLKGSWVDISDDPDKKLGDAAMKVHRGGAWLFGYDAPLAKLPCFLRVDDE